MEIRSSGEQVFDVCFHPLANIVAVAGITGLIEVFHCDGEHAGRAVMQSQLHSSSCRGIEFGFGGERLYSVSSDRSWKATDSSGVAIMHCPDAHESSINKIKMIDGLSGSDIFATGDDSGCVRLWDSRLRGPVITWKLHEDFVSDFTYSSDHHTLVSVGGDACLCVYDIRKESNCVKSDAQEAELLCVEFIKHDRKVVCGTDDGVLLYFSWGQWGDCSDRYPGHPESVDCLLKIDESTLLTGSSDGMIRAVTLLPNKILGLIGHHDEFPVEGMATSHDRRNLVSYSHDEILRFWDVSMFADDVDDEEKEEGEEVEPADIVEEAVASGQHLDGEDEKWEDVSEEDDSGMVGESENESESSSESDSEEERHKSNSSRVFKTPAESFFADI